MRESADKKMIAELEPSSKVARVLIDRIIVVNNNSNSLKRNRNTNEASTTPKKKNDDSVIVMGYYAAQSPAVRSITAFQSMKTDPKYPLEAAIGPPMKFRLDRTITNKYGPVKHALSKGAVFQIECRNSISKEEENIVINASLVRCSGDGKHIFKMLYLLSSNSYFEAPPIVIHNDNFKVTNDDDNYNTKKETEVLPYVIFGLSSSSELQYAISLWEQEGETVVEGGKRIQKHGERHADALESRKPKLRQWITSTTVKLQKLSSSMTNAASRQPLAKKSHMIIIGTALKLFYDKKNTDAEKINNTKNHVSSINNINNPTTTTIDVIPIMKREDMDDNISDNDNEPNDYNGDCCRSEKQILNNDSNNNNEKILIQIPTNLDSKREKKRLQAWADRKRPQLQWMLQQIDTIIASSSCTKKVVRILDIGGGKGDLAVYVAQQRGPQRRQVLMQQQQQQYTIKAIDIHEPSIQVGKEALRQAGFVNSDNNSDDNDDPSNNNNNIADILFCDAQDLLLPDNNDSSGSVSKEEELIKEQAAIRNRVGKFDIVVGLHCCGGLSETAMLIALQQGVPFCICTCCFCSHPKLCHLLPPDDNYENYWRRLAHSSQIELDQQQLSTTTAKSKYRKELHIEKALSNNNTQNDINSFSKKRIKEIRKQLLRACEREGARATDDSTNAGSIASNGLWNKIFPSNDTATPQLYAMAAVNSMRLHAFSNIISNNTRNFLYKPYKTKLVRFDSSVSTRNMCIIGIPQEQGEEAFKEF